MPPSVSVNGISMFEDQIAFALMAFNASEFSVPKDVLLPYVLPYAYVMTLRTIHTSYSKEHQHRSYHEARVNWRPLFFAKFFSIVQGAKSTAEVMERLVSPNIFTNWTGTLWPSHPFYGKKYDQTYALEWSSSTSPPVINPFGFAAYVYGVHTSIVRLIVFERHSSV